MIPYIITIKQEKPPDVTIRAFREMNRKAMREGGQFWHSEIAPLHFQANNRFRYHHVRRTTKHNRRKQREAGRRGIAPEAATTDGIYTGNLKRAALGFAVIRGFPTRFRVTMKLPSYVGFKRRSTVQPNLAAELTKSTNDDKRQVAQVVENSLAKSLHEFRAVRSETFS